MDTIGSRGEKISPNFIEAKSHPREAGGLILESAKGTGEAHPCSHDAWKNFWVVVSIKHVFNVHPENWGRFPIFPSYFFQMGWLKTTN